MHVTWTIIWVVSFLCPGNVHILKSILCLHLPLSHHKKKSDNLIILLQERFLFYDYDFPSSQSHFSCSVTPGFKHFSSFNIYSVLALHLTLLGLR